MTHKNLVSALMGQDGFEREIAGIKVAVKGLGVNDQLILLGGRGLPILRAAGPAEHVPIFHAADKAQASRDSLYAPLSSAQFGA
jgi:hypothetical protein